EREPVLIRAQELSEQLGEDGLRMEALLALAQFRHLRREHGIARELARRVLLIAEPAQMTAMGASAHYLLGSVSSFLGEFEAAREHLESASASFGAKPFRNSSEANYASAMTTVLATTLLFLGYPAAALRKCRETLDDARRLHEPVALAQAL